LMEQIPPSPEPPPPSFERPEGIKPDPPASLLPPASPASMTPLPVQSEPDTGRPAPGSTVRRPRFELRVRLGRHWLSVAFGSIAMLVLAPLSYGSWRYWNIPWLAPNPVGDVIVRVKALLPSEKQIRLAVLPFASSGGDPDAETLAHGLSGDITNALGRV